MTLGHPVDALADRYHELMALRAEALKKYGSNVMSTMKGPPARAYVPLVKPSRNVKSGGTRIGPITLLNQPPFWRHVQGLISAMSGTINVLEIGPGSGEFAAHLRRVYPEKIGRYFGLERDKNVQGSYERIDSIADLNVPVDLVLASEVFEHMPADDLYRFMLLPLRGRLSKQAYFIASVPNPIAPAGIARDFTHVQSYPWYDFYAIVRLEFSAVEIFRTFYIWTLPRLLFLLPRIAVCTVQELDWCDGVICVASGRRFTA